MFLLGLRGQTSETPGASKKLSKRLADPTHGQSGLKQSRSGLLTEKQPNGNYMLYLREQIGH